MSSWQEIVRQGGSRAQDRCEYCRMHQSLQGATFHIEHIVPTAQGGPSTDHNLALACPGCNLHKSDRVEAPDPITGARVPLFNPRAQAWNEHFAWNGWYIVGRTPAGRATVEALGLNHPRRLRIREAESLSGIFPP